MLQALRSLARRGRRRLASSPLAYRWRVRRELGNFAACEAVHELPAIFHYWSNRYLRPKLEQHGFDHPDAFFLLHADRCLASAGDAPARIVSVGAGNCDMEVRLARSLVDRGRRDFVLDCIDVNATMLERGRAMAAEAGVAGRMAFTCADLNRSRIAGPVAAVIANQSLHHVTGLERLFDQVRDALVPAGRFIVSDMIGRNGHMRWPEAKAIVDELWAELPMRFRYNHQLRRTEERFQDWDCSVSGFEGIRAQDILPLLVERFGFDLFLGFANVVDPFIDRGFGPNYDANAEADRAFIDRVHERDEAEIRAGRITPTHMFAVMTTGEGAGVYHDGLAPRAAIRAP